MRFAHTLLTVSFALSATPALSRSFLPAFLRDLPAVRQLQQLPILHFQSPFMGSQQAGEGPSTGDLMVSDVIGKERNINIFAGLTRDVSTVSSRLEDKTQNSTILAPTNSALQSLKRKPWEDSEEYGKLGESAYKGNEGESRAHANLRQFVEAHVIGESGWLEHERLTNMQGDSLWWITKNGKKWIQPEDVEVLNVIPSVGNGEIWVIKEALNNY